MKNYFRDHNRFSLAPPPIWWLQAMQEFDPSLVILPSRVEPVYRIAQRRRHDDRALPVMANISQHGDAIMLRQYGLILVTALFSATGGWIWSTDVFTKLAQRAGWRNGLTPEQTAKAADDADRAETTKRHADRSDRLDHQIRHAETIAKLHTGKTIFVDGYQPTGAIVDRTGGRYLDAPRLPAATDASRIATV